MTAPTMGEERASGCVKMKMVSRDTDIYSFVNSKEEKEHLLLQLELKKKKKKPLPKVEKFPSATDRRKWTSTGVQQKPLLESGFNATALICVLWDSVSPSRSAVHVEPVPLDQWDELFHLDLGNLRVFLQDKGTRAGLLTWQMNPWKIHSDHVLSRTVCSIRQMCGLYLLSGWAQLSFTYIVPTFPPLTTAVLSTRGQR